MDLQLTGKKTLVTGATAGIGYATALLFAQEGADVIITGRKQEEADAKAAEITTQSGNRNVKGVAVDFSRPEEIEALINKVTDVDILINNAGMFNQIAFEEITDEDWLQIFEVNVLSGIRLSRHYFPKMLAKNEGRIIFISSESALNIPEEMIHYGMSKTAQLAVSRGLAKLTKGTNVTVNCVLPGPTYSRGVEKMMEGAPDKEAATKDFFENKRPTSLIQRFANVDEVANMVVYVASGRASATNGAALRVDGGVVNSIM